MNASLPLVMYNYTLVQILQLWNVKIRIEQVFCFVRHVLIGGAGVDHKAAEDAVSQQSWFRDPVSQCTQYILVQTTSAWLVVID